MRRQVSPADWTRTLVSRPGMLVKFCGLASLRTSRQTGALFPGCVTLRCCCSLTEFSGAGAGAWASVGVASSDAAKKTAPSLEKNFMPILLELCRALVADALGLVLAVAARLDPGLPAAA